MTIAAMPGSNWTQGQPTSVSKDGVTQWDQTDLQLAIFTMLWAVASLFHMAHSSVFDTSLNFALLTLAAMYAIIRPSLAGLLVLAVLQLFDAFFRMPFTTNHWIFTAFANVTILYAWIFSVIKQKTFRVNGHDVFDRFAPVIRTELIILYFFAVFHKLNSSFFSPQDSCATDLLLAQQIDSVIPLSSEFLKWNAYFTIFIESLIPLMLCFRHSRNFGILFGLVFHGFLSYSTYNAFYDFSSMVFATYFLFTLPSFSKTIFEKFALLKAGLSRQLTPSAFTWGRLVLILGGCLICLAILAVLNKKLDDFKSVHLYFFWTAYSVVVVYVFVRFGWSRSSSATNETLGFRFAHWSFVLLPLIVFVNGTSPYLGLKTENSYAMFSNLRTEDGVSNHYLVPASIQVFDFQKQTADIVSSTDPYLQKLAGQNKSMVLFELRNYVHDRRPGEVTFLYKGERHVYKRGDTTQNTLLAKNPYVLAKLMKFRPFSKSGEQPCAH